MFRDEKQRMNAPSWLLKLVLVVAVGPLAGCGDEGRGGVSVSGTVTLDGQPMPAGSVVFVPLTTGHKAAAKINAGSFVFGPDEGPIPGKYRVEIYAPEASSVPLDDPLAYAKSGPNVPPPNPVAAEFNEQSTLTADVMADGDWFSYEVRSVKR